MPRLGIIVASTRPGRIGLPVAQWVHAAAVEHGGFEVELVDLAEVALPIYDEPNHPRLKEYVHEHTKAWSAQVDALDALVIVHPEYNHSFNAAIKNAIDYLHFEWAHKPAGLVSYGGVAAGTRASQALKPVLAILGVHVIPAAVNIPFVAQFVKDGVVEPNDVMVQAVGAMLDSLVALEGALSPLRAEAN